MKKIDKNFPIYEVENLLNYDNYDIELLKKKYIEEHKKNLNPEKGFNAVVDFDSEILEDLIVEFTNLVNKKWGGIDVIKSSYIMVNNEDFCPINWHNHLTTSDIVGVYYFSVPKSMKGGNISFQTDDYDLSHRPKENSLLIFPDWMLHTTNYIQGKEHRISINIEGIYE